LGGTRFEKRHSINEPAAPRHNTKRKIHSARALDPAASKKGGKGEKPVMGGASLVLTNLGRLSIYHLQDDMKEYR